VNKIRLKTHIRYVIILPYFEFLIKTFLKFRKRVNKCIRGFYDSTDKNK